VGAYQSLKRNCRCIGNTTFYAACGPDSVDINEFDDSMFGSEAPVIRDDGRLGSVFSFSKDHLVRSYDLKSLSQEDRQHYASLSKHQTIFRHVSHCVYRLCVQMGNDDRHFLHPTSWSASKSKLITNYHAIPDEISLGARQYRFHSICGISKSTLADFHYDEFWRFDRSVIRGNFERIAVDDVNGVDKTVLADPYSKIRWNKTWGKNVVDISMINRADSKRNFNAHLLPACVDEQDLLNGMQICFVGYYGFLSKIEYSSLTRCLFQRYADEGLTKDEIHAIIDNSIKKLSHRNKIISCGHISNVDSKHYVVASSCSSSVGCSGSPYFLLDNPKLGVIGVHLGHGIKDTEHEMYANRTIFMTVNHPQFVAKWALHCYTGLSDEDKNHVEPYVKKHWNIISHVKKTNTCF